MGNLLSNDLFTEYELKRFQIKKVLAMKPLFQNELLCFDKDPDNLYMLKHVNLYKHNQIIEIHRIKGVIELQVDHICRFVFLARTRSDMELQILFTYGFEPAIPFRSDLNLY